MNRNPAAVRSTPIVATALWLFAWCVSAPGGAAYAQDLTPIPSSSETPVLLMGATVFSIANEPLDRGALLIEDGEITFVGPATHFETNAPPEGTLTIDVTGKHLYPGLIAATSQVGLIETSAVRATRDENETGEFTPEARAAVAINPDSTLIPVTRLGGVLLTGVAPRGGRVPGTVSATRLAGWTWEDMTVDDRAALLLSWPRVRPVQRWYVVDTPQEQWRQIERERGEIDALFDAAIAYAAERPDGVAPRPDAPDTDVRLEALRPFVAGPSNERKPVFIVADDADQITDAVTWAVERGVKAVIVGGRDAERCVDVLTAHGVPVILNGVHRFPRRADAPYDEAFNQPARLAAAGVTFAINSSDRTGNVRNLPHEAALARRHGLGDAETLRAITLTPAEILGVDDRYGSLEVGKSATLIVTDGDVLEVTSRVEYAWIDGKRVPMTSKQTELRDRFREKYRDLGLVEN